MGVIIFGLPKFLSWSLDTPYPLASITSGSMWPALHEGDLVFIEGVEKDELKVGDIVERYLQDNDIVLLNRQPTLHIGGMLAHKVKIKKGKTFRFNLAVCQSFNSDFDF